MDGLKGFQLFNPHKAALNGTIGQEKELTTYKSVNGLSVWCNKTHKGMLALC